MQITIDRHALSDAPYKEGNEGICTFDQTQLDNFVSEIIYGNQTCYLVSGYRGVGKTSFINKVRQLVELKSQSIYREGKRASPVQRNEPETYYPVFVHTSFAKYNSQTAFLRQMIRTLFIAFEEKKLGDKSLFSLLKDDIQKEFDRLNQRTFFDVKTQYEISNELTTETTREFSSKIDELAKGVFKAVIPGPALILAGQLSNYFKWPSWISIVSWIAGLAYFTFGLFQLKNVKSHKSSVRNTKNSNELYDDEIASYHFEKILKALKGEGFKVVFILDELDKVSDKELSTLVNEMKPHLLSGWADFIVIAGQQLTYKYVSAFSEDDDEVVGSLFSKVFHVPLKGTNELRSIVKEKVFKGASFEAIQLEAVDEFIEQFVFHSARIPRILVNQIRQSITWHEGQPHLLIPDSSNQKKYREVIKEIEGIIKDSIDPKGHKEVVRDYLIVQLYRTASMLNNCAGIKLDRNKILGKFQKSTFFHHPLYFNDLSPCLTKLIDRLQPILGYIPADADNNLVEKIPENSDQGIPSPAEISNIALAKSLEAFKQELQECSWVLKVTYIAHQRGSKEDVSKLTTFEFLERFTNNGFLSLNLPNDTLFKQFINTPSILDDKKNLLDAYKMAQEAKLDFNTVAYTVLESYLRKALIEIFKGYALTKFPGEGEPDYLLLNEMDSLSDLLVDFKFLKTGISNLKTHEIASRLFNYNRKTTKGNYLTLVVFTSEAKDNYDSESFRLRSELRNTKFPDGRNIAMNEEFNVKILSIQHLNRIYDELILLKNEMFSYRVDNQGLPVSGSYLTTIPLREFVFENQIAPSNDPSRNDHILLQTIKSSGQFVIKITPQDQTKYWRCGLKFSPNGIFPKFEEGRHIEGYPDIHVSVGEPKNANGKVVEKDGKYVWEYPNRLKITNNFITHKEEEDWITPNDQDWSIDNYDGGTITLEFNFSHKDKAVLKISEDDRHLNTFTYPNDKLKFFRISGWADRIDFKLKTQILVDAQSPHNILKVDQISLAAPGHPFNITINANILASMEGVFSIWGFVADVHQKIFGKILNMYLVGYASNDGEDLNNPALARYPNAWSISRVLPTQQAPKGAWVFHCNNIAKDATRLILEDALPNGWHLFTIAWSKESNFIKFIINEKIIGESSFINWPTDFSHSIRIGTWANGKPEFAFNSKVGPCQFVPQLFQHSIVREYLRKVPQ